MEAFFDVLCHSSITEAHSFSRAKGERAQKTLFRRLVKFVLAKMQGAEREARSVELVTLPLNEIEESWLEEYLAEGDGSHLQGASDTLALRSLTTGRLDSVRDHSELHRDRSINGLSWARLTHSIKPALKEDSFAL